MGLLSDFLAKESHLPTLPELFKPVGCFSTGNLAEVIETCAE